MITIADKEGWYRDFTGEIRHGDTNGHVEHATFELMCQNGKEIYWVDGTWRKGTFGGNSVWLDGTWNDGTWLNGTWHKGVWKDGEWRNGIWCGGAWEHGTWRRGLKMGKSVIGMQS